INSYCPNRRMQISRVPLTTRKGSASSRSWRMSGEVSSPGRCGLVHRPGSSCSSGLRLTKVSSIAMGSTRRTRLPRRAVA
ncbi:hypothetical protein PIB30_065668, partial [Stylosanthes scabra]|nr:hypothetical protein [Stylosanthes scabra]